MGLFSDLYNTVAKFFRPQENQLGEDTSKSVAQNRLKLVLMQDRTNLTPKVLEQMRGEMIDLLSKYLEMDKDLLELNFEQDGDQVALMLSIPVIRAKEEDEIAEASASSSKEESGGGSEDEIEAEYETDIETSPDDEITECETEEVKPKRKKRTSKKVSAPEDFDNSTEGVQAESSDESSCESSEQLCENTEA